MSELRVQKTATKAETKKQTGSKMTLADFNHWEKAGLSALTA